MQKSEESLPSHTGDALLEIIVAFVQKVASIWAFPAAKQPVVNTITMKLKP